MHSSPLTIQNQNHPQSLSNSFTHTNTHTHPHPHPTNTNKHHNHHHLNHFTNNPIPTFQNRRRAFSSSEVRKSKHGNHMTMIIRPHQFQHHPPPQSHQHHRSNCSSSSFDSFESIHTGGTTTTASSEDLMHSNRNIEQGQEGGFHNNDGSDSFRKKNLQHRLPSKLCVRQNSPTMDVRTSTSADNHNLLHSSSWRNHNPLHSHDHNHNHNHIHEPNANGTNCNLSMSDLNIPNLPKSRRRHTASCTNTSNDNNMCYNSTQNHNSNCNSSHVNVTNVQKGRNKFTSWFATMVVFCILLYTRSSHDQNFDPLVEHSRQSALLSSSRTSIPSLNHKGLQQQRQEGNLKEGLSSMEGEVLVLKIKKHPGEQIVIRGDHDSISDTNAAAHNSDSNRNRTASKSSSTSSKSSSTTSSNRKKLRQPQLAQANSLATQPLSSNTIQMPQPILKEFVLSENDIKNIDSVLTDGRGRRPNYYSTGANVNGMILKPMHYFIALGCISLLVIVVESYLKERREYRQQQRQQQN